MRYTMQSVFGKHESRDMSNRLGRVHRPIVFFKFTLSSVSRAYLDIYWKKHYYVSNETVRGSSRLSVDRHRTRYTYYSLQTCYYNNYYRRRRRRYRIGTFAAV